MENLVRAVNNKEFIRLLEAQSQVYWKRRKLFWDNKSN
jgi:hypothetical protein